MKSTLLLIIGILPLSLLSIVNLIASFGGAALSPIPPLPREMQNLAESTDDAKQKAEAAYPYLAKVDITLAKKNDISPNAATDLNEITRDVLQYVKLRKSLEGIWDVHLMEGASTPLTTTILNTLIKRYSTLGYEGLDSENGKKYREYVEQEKLRLVDLLGESAEHDQEVANWLNAEAAFNAGEFASARRLLEAVNMQIILKFSPPIVTTSRIANLKTACEYNVALKVIEDEQSSLQLRLQFLTSTDVDDLLIRIRNFEQKYPSPPLETDQKPYMKLQMAKKAFSLFNELLVREISNEPTAWPGELQKLVNDIANLREFGDEFSRPIVEKQKEKLVDKLAILALGQALEVPPQLDMFECLYYVSAQKDGRILFAAKIIKNKNGWVLNNNEKPPQWFYKENRLPLIPFSIRDSEVSLGKLSADKQTVVKEMLNDANNPQKSPLLQFYQNHNKLIEKLEIQSSDIGLWTELLEYIPEARVFLGKYNSIGGGYLEVVDVKLNNLESVAEKIVLSRSEIERFLQQ